MVRYQHRHLVAVLLVLCVTLVSGAPLSGDGKTLSSTRSPIVNTIYGQVRGRRMVYSGEVVDEFKGIPFAQPPVGELRWRRPEPPIPWKAKVLEAGDYGLPCTQWSKDAKNNGEDCLFVNVWVPKGVEMRLREPLPVMVWTFGGGFQTGNTAIFPSHELASKGNVIIVSHNYRVSTLGGLSTSDGNSPGNYMIWDARAALLWVRDNIANFGGDPSRVTIFGSSSGGAIVSHMVASPLCEGLFHRALSLSGVSSGPVGLQVDNVENARNVALLMGCPSADDDMQEMMECLRTRNETEVDRAGYPAMALLTGQIPGWGPVVDGQIVPILAKQAYANGAGRNIDYLTGRNNDDAAGFVYMNMRGLPGEHGNIAATKESLYAAMSYVLRSYRPGDTDTLIQAILKKYPLMNSNDVTTRTQATSQSITDAVFADPSFYEADMHSQNTKKKGTGKKTFVYNFKYRPSFVHYAPWVIGSHTDDYYLFFGEPYRRKLRESRLGNFTDTDRFVGNSMIKYYTNFAHTGDPNKGPHTVPAQWPEYDFTKQQYMEFGASMTPTKVDADLKSRIDFWRNEWPKITVPSHEQTLSLHHPEDDMAGFHILANMAADCIQSMGGID